MSVTHTEPSPTPVVVEDCPAREILDRVGDKWSVLVIVLLGQHSPLQRVASRRRSISQRMFTLTVRALQRDGLVSRTVYATVPARVDYELTDLGRTLLVPLGALYDWASTVTISKWRVSSTTGRLDDLSDHSVRRRPRRSNSSGSRVRGDGHLPPPPSEMVASSTRQVIVPSDVVLCGGPEASR
jgi:DNA-binding HxlR family transcriptional regulator